MRKLEKIRSYYLPRIQSCEEDYKILGWEDSRSHRARFESFISNIEISKYKTFLDVGCGVGSILDFFKEKKIDIEYTGIDIIAEMVEIAAKRHTDNRFYCIDLLEYDSMEEKFDIIYASGIFNIKLGNNKAFLEKMINRFYELSRHIFGFNLLHHNSPDKEKSYFYFSPEECIKILEHNNLKLKKTEVIEQYLNNDFTIICEKI